MNKQDAKLKEEIMTRVRTIYAIRKFAPTLLLFGILSTAIVILVDIPSVLFNLINVMEINGSALSFLASAFSHTIILIKMALVAEVIALFLVLKISLPKLLPNKFITA